MSVSIPLGDKSGASMRGEHDHPFFFKSSSFRSEFASRGGERWPERGQSHNGAKKPKNRRQSSHSTATNCTFDFFSRDFYLKEERPKIASPCRETFLTLNSYNF